MKRILREPLLHFLLLGAAIFVIYGMMTRNAGVEPGRIVITQGQIAAIAEGFVRTRQRPPSREEMEGLIHDRVHEEVYYREALALGLDKDDLIIRRRLQQKMEFISDDVAAQVQPSDVELNAYLNAHADMFRTPPRFSFRQVYLDPEKHGDKLARDAAQLLAQLKRGGSDVAALGDALMLAHQYDALPASEIRNLFGEKFAASLDQLAPGQWQGPIESSYGEHLVLLGERTEAHVPALADVRDAVNREWTNARRAEANEKLYATMLTHYVVTIERASAVAEQQKLATVK